MDFVTGLNVTIYGLGIVFLALLVVMFVIMVLSRLFAAVTGKDFMAAPATSEPDAPAADVTSQEVNVTSKSVKFAPPPASSLVVKPMPYAAASLAPAPSAPAASKQVVTSGKITAPLPGKVISVAVKAGDSALQGKELCVIEAMKMANSIRAQQDCTVREVLVSVGDSVPFGAPLFGIE